MKKLLFTCAAVAGISLALGATAFAAEIQNDAGYIKKAGTYSVKSDLSGYVTNNVPDQMTIIIIPEKAYNAATIKDSDILYIDQTAAGKGIFQDVGILGGTSLADGTYYVKIGGENIAQDGIIVEKFTVSNGTTYKVGDVDGNNSITIGDVTTLTDYILINIEKFTKASDSTILPYFVGDADNNNSVTIGDVTTVIDGLLGAYGEDPVFPRKTYVLPAGTTPASTYPAKTN